jgi:hypothetical protein
MDLEIALQETAYIEADDAIARALQQTPTMRAALNTLAPELRAAVGATIRAIRTAAAKRHMELQDGASLSFALVPWTPDLGAARR